MDDPVTPESSDEDGRISESAAGSAATPAAPALEILPPTSENTSAPSTTATWPTVKGRCGVCLVLLMVVLADVTCYRSHGFTGLAVFLAAASVLICLGIPSRSLRLSTVCVWSMLAVAAWRLTDHGNNLLLVSGFWLLFALALTFRSCLPFVFDVLIFALECLPGGGEFLTSLNSSLREKVTQSIDDRQTRPWAEILLPVLAAGLFGGIFVMANPDVMSLFSRRLSLVWEYLSGFLKDFSPVQIVFWIVVAWTTGGLLRSRITQFSTAESDRDPAWGTDGTPLYAAYRNTLVTLIVLFTAYLTFESRAFVDQVPPAGFTYSSYAHEGAAWLTAALALATLILSIIFRGATMTDDRLPRLRRLAVVWSTLNFLLAIAVCNRMLIYINFNGMTRMRVVALLGIGSVVGGLTLAVIKIYRRRSFSWLIQRQLWVVQLAAFLFAVVPVDTLIHTWNVRQILSGNPAPIVQITAHSLDDECLPVLLPLCRVSDPLISEGMCGMIMIREHRLSESIARSRAAGWTAWQRHRQQSLARLRDSQEQWDIMATRAAAAVALQNLADYAYAEYW